METQLQNIALSCDDSYISLLLTDDPHQNLENNETALMSDENCAEKLQLQEAIMSSLITLQSSHFPDHIEKKVSMDIGESSSSSSSSAQHIYCEICAEIKTNNDFFPIQNCTHKFCTQCISKHVSIKIQKGTMVEKFPCPGTDCEGVLDIETCREIVPKDVLSAWDEMICESMILPSERFYCPYKSCSGLMVNDSEMIISEAECPFCKRLFCARCEVPWHSGIGCDEFSRLGENEREREDVMVHELAKTNKWQRCPSCKFFVDKKDGCLHMTCRCGFQFCYACGKTWSSTHGGCR